MNRFKATLAIAAFSLLSLTACGEEAKNAAEGAKDAMGKTTQTATEGAQKAGDSAMKVGDGAMKAATSAKDAVASNVASVAGVLSLKDSIPNLKDSAASALAAVKTGDFKTAQGEVTKLQESWAKVDDIVKKQSGESFKKISTTLKTVQTDLNAPNPDKAKIIAELQSLSSAVSGLAALK